MPPSAKAVLDRLLGIEQPYASVDDFAKDLQQLPTDDHTG